MKKTLDGKTAIVFSDTHVTYHDKESISNFLEYVSDTKPDVIVANGDFYDCFGISRFDKDPNRIDTLQQEIDEGAEIWHNIRKAAPKAHLALTEGNHEARIQKTLMRNPGLYSLRDMRPENLFQLKNLGVEWIPSDKIFRLNKNLVVTHGAIDDGCKMSPHSAYSAKANLDKWGVSGLSGHTHRFGSHYKTLAEEVLGWHELGCLADVHPDYVKNPNWQQGFATVYYTTNRFHVVPTLITNHQFIAGGRKYG